MKYGFFDDTAAEYVITTPRTPYPWLNYLGCEEFFGLITNTAGGYCFYRDALLRRLTRYRYNGVPLDSGGRYFYIREGRDFWSPGWKPVRAELESYECRHGLGYTRIRSSRNGLAAELLFFVPLGVNAEVHQVSLENLGRRHRAFSLFSMVEFCLWNAQEDAANFQRNFSTGEVEVEGPVIYHKTEYRERRNHFAFYCGRRVRGGAAGRLRHGPGGLPGPVQRLRGPARRGGRPQRRLAGAWLVPDRLPPAIDPPGPG